jgi:glycosyltransferase involved in cell wall biosynthesis
LVSVILPTYNRAHCLGAAIDSVLNQSMDDLELIVVDDGSTDTTADVVAGVDRRVRYIRQPNRGVSAARNCGIRLARGRWISFIDSDDEWLPHKLHRQISELRCFPVAQVHGPNLQLQMPGGRAMDLFTLRCRGELTRRPRLVERPLALTLASCFMLQGILVSRGACLAAGPFDTRMPLYEDFDFINRLAMAGPWCVSPTIAARVLRKDEPAHSLSNLRLTRPVQSAATFVRIYRELLQRSGTRRRERRAIRRRLSAATFDLAEQLARRGHGGLARAFARRSAREAWQLGPISRMLLAQCIGIDRVSRWRTGGADAGWRRTGRDAARTHTQEPSTSSCA